MKKKGKGKTRNTWGKTKERKGKKTKASSKESDFTCFNAMKMFVSKIKKASNLVRQAKRIESFLKITNNKLAKVGNKYVNHCFLIISSYNIAERGF